MRDLTKQCLYKLENLIDEEHIEKTRELQRKTFNFEKVERTPVEIVYDVPENEWPSYDFTEIFHDREKMLLSELKNIYLGVKLKDDRLYGIRANYGTGIIASIFGCPIHIFGNMLPCAKEVEGIEAVRKIVEKGIPDIYGGICGKALETVAYFRDVLWDYPKICRNVGSMLLDIQGTFDNASIIWGSDIFLGVYDEPELLSGLLEVIVGTIRKIILEHRKIDGESKYEDSGDFEYIGGICLRNDSCINLSGEMYEELVKPFDKKLLGEFTGNIHFCGRAHQWWRRLLDIPGLKAVNPFQGEFYNLEEMYAECERHKIAIYQWTVPVEEKEKKIIKTGFSRVAMFGGDYEAARRLLDKAHCTGWVD